MGCFCRPPKCNQLESKYDFKDGGPYSIIEQALSFHNGSKPIGEAHLTQERKHGNRIGWRDDGSQQQNQQPGKPQCPVKKCSDDKDREEETWHSEQKNCEPIGGESFHVNTPGS